MASSYSQLSYRPDIDGLRAIAVLGVVLYHAGVHIPGGYVGVDVFFVISGFLITSLILKDLRNQAFCLFGFWERRARRILPALTVMVTATLVAGWFLLLPDDFQSLGKSVIAVLTLASNIKFYRETGYFAEASEQKPLLHTWSLSLEEQFYLLMPLLLMLLFRLRRSSWGVFVLAVISGLSLVMAVYGSYHSSDAAFFLLPGRAWELAAGALLAFAPPVKSGRLRAAMAWIGLLGIFLPFILYPPGIRFPGLTAMPPVFGAVLLIWAGTRPAAGSSLTLPHRLLGSRPFVGIGLASYSLYLWHWPLFAFQAYVSVFPAPLSSRLALLGLSGGLAWLSLRYVERPFRERSQLKSRTQVFVWSATTIVSLAAAAVAILLAAGFPQRLPAEGLRFAKAAQDPPFQSLTAADIPERLLKLGTGNKPSQVFVWGDSHAAAILPAVDAVCKEMGLSAQAAIALSTAPVTGWIETVAYGLQKDAPIYNQAVLDYIQNASAHGDLRCVIYAAKWTRYLTGTPEDRFFREALRSTVIAIQATGCQMVILQEVPTFSFHVPKALAISNLLGRDVSDCAIRADVYSAISAVQKEFFGGLVSGHLHSSVLDPWSALAGSQTNFFPADDDGSLYRDRHHLNTHGSMRLTGSLRALIKAAVDGTTMRRSPP